MFMKTFSITVITTLRHNNAYNMKIDFKFLARMFFEHFPVRIALCTSSTDCFIIYLVMTLRLKNHWSILYYLTGWHLVTWRSINVKYKHIVLTDNEQCYFNVSEDESPRININTGRFNHRIDQYLCTVTFFKMYSAPKQVSYMFLILDNRFGGKIQNLKSKLFK